MQRQKTGMKQWRELEKTISINMLFNVVASGSKGNSTIIKSHNTIILIDMGISFTRLEEGCHEIGIEPNMIEGVLFTHEHADHVSGLKFIKTRKQYALEGTLPSQNHQVVQLFDPFVIGELVITPIKTSHDAKNPCGYVVENKTEKLVYFTDTGMFPSVNFPFVKNPDYLIIEANHDIQMLLKTKRTYELKQRILSDVGHLSNEDSALVAKEIIGNKTKEIILAHISEEANTPETALKAYKQIFSFYGLDIDKYHVRVANQWHSTIGGHDED